jgi:hypothetical protein
MSAKVKHKAEQLEFTYRTNTAIVDDLGRLLAKLAELEQQAEEMKNTLRNEFGPGEYEGRLFRATVGEDGFATKYDNEAIREKLIELGHRRFVNARRSKDPKKGSVRIVARTGIAILEGRKKR